MTNFNRDVEFHLTTNYSDTLSLSGKIQLYRSTLGVMLDKHAPLRMKKVPDRVKIPWFNDEMATAIWKRRKAEWKWYALRFDTLRFLEFYRI